MTKTLNGKHTPMLHHDRLDNDALYYWLINGSLCPETMSSNMH